jgi:phospholipid/cholesterol/gamma-HCH transport system substrate-binding protein
VTTNVELQQILANLFPLLRSIRPADLDTTLNALSTALSGRGEKIGRTLSGLDTYLTAINQHLPTLREDLVRLASVSRTYSLAAPDLVRLLRNATTTARTIASKQAELHGFFVDMTGLAATSTTVLTENEQAIVREGQLAVPLTRLLDTYSPEFPCLLEGTTRYSNNLNQIFRHNRVSQTLSLDAKQRHAYTAADRPQYGEVGHGPWCLGLPYPKVPVGPLDLKNGTNYDAGGG